MIVKLNSKTIVDYMKQNNLDVKGFCKKCKISKDKFYLLMNAFSPQSIDTLINIHIGTGINLLKLIEERK
ncbi:MAG: hypothetical protein IJ542_01660 [Clostridia bacterium]|nr:hypothetical protein [Clostridia bacterium]